MTHHDSEFRIDTDDLSSGPSVGMVSQVITELRNRKPETQSGPRRHVLDGLVAASLRDEGFDPSASLHHLMSQRITEPEIVDLYVPKAAEAIGALWMEDEISFADVTVSALRLQMLVREVTHTAKRPPQRMRALIVLPEQDQHFLGMIVATAQLERLGCVTDVSICESASSLVERILLDRPDAVLFSCSRVEALPPIARSVKAVRKDMRPAPMFALGGSILNFGQDLIAQSGVDIVSASVGDVVEVSIERMKVQAST